MSTRFLITAGPTQEPIDPVRYLSNHSSGKMGYALAESAAKKGASVILISGPVALNCPLGVKRVCVTTGEEMYKAVMAHVASCDIFISVAAVADYRVAIVSSQKLKKNSSTLELSLVRNVDILSAVAQLKNAPFTVGFAAETENLTENALTKLKAKKLDMIVANDVADTKGGFKSDQNAATVFWDGGEQHFPLQSKTQLAESLLTLIEKQKK
jgi:phosphopantothenoylcysteine decarboxylase/phosphopantothenate--cysteine ligase